MNDCPFCHPFRPVIAQTELAMSFYDGYPTSPGHALVVPKKHVETYFECTTEEKTENRVGPSQLVNS
jgi:diadenosine tetraphosphate (Ap4A) HIT family hydrolase